MIARDQYAANVDLMDLTRAAQHAEGKDYKAYHKKMTENGS